MVKTLALALASRQAARLRFVYTGILFLHLLGITPSFGSDLDSLNRPVERHLRNIRQLTHGGTNAEAYFSFDGRQLIFQSTRPPYDCDQIFVMNTDGGDPKLVSTGKGVTTCGYFLPDGKHVLFASTHLTVPGCIPRPDKSKGYVWGVYGSYEIFVADTDGSHLHILTSSPGYDAEATVSPQGDRIVFTSSRDGDLELYTMNLDGTDIRRVTHEVGYDGGAFFSWDGKRIVYRSHHPADSISIASYKTLLSEELVRPTEMEINVCNADGSGWKELTHNGKANFAPFFHPDNHRIIYASNEKDPKGRQFQLYLMNDDGSRTEEVTFEGGFNAFPIFDREAKHIVFVSDRNAKGRYEFNIFIADWIE
jgi:TolB protein